MRAAMLALALGACAPVGPYTIARDLDGRLQDLRNWPLVVRCQAVRDAEERCRRAGLPADCAWDGWHDADHDAWTIAQCRVKEERP